MTHVHAEEIVQIALSQEGDRYVFGAEASPSDSNPSAFDCSELIQWACARTNLSPTIPDGSWIQARHCDLHDTMIDVDEAITTRGALLFKFSADPLTGARPSSSHVAMSLGDGFTIEARSTTYGVGVFTAEGRGWTHAALIPGADYTEGVSNPQFQPAWDRALEVGMFSKYTKPFDVVTAEKLAVFLERVDVI